MQINRSLSAIIATILIAGAPLAASAQVSFGVGVGFGGPGWSVGFAAYSPPVLPVYSMPPAPYPGWQWIPGYWGWGGYGYYWVPGYWAAPPAVGLYWTPGYWGYANGGYAWNAGYWGPTVGFYGGINYGYGYFGVGFVGGYWSGSVFNYNTAVVNVNRTVIRNTFVDPRTVHGAVFSHSRVSFNGGHGGIAARATAAQRAARTHAIPATAAQRAHQQVAARDRNLLAAVNHGHPGVTAVQKPFSATHHPANMHAITAADRRAAQRTMHGAISASAHHIATARHGTASAATHHSTTATHGTIGTAAHHSASATHGTVGTAAHHSAPVHHSAPMHHSAPTHGAFGARSYPRFSSGGHSSYSHVGYGGRPPSGGSTHAASGGRPPSGGSTHAASGGRPPSGGSTHATSGGHGGGGGGRPPRAGS
jgi:hypothetical protein